MIKKGSLNKKKNTNLKKWLRKYWLGLLLIGFIIDSVILTLFFANKIANLQESILLISLLSPYAILYIQHLQKNKTETDRLKIIIKKIINIINFIIGNSASIETLNVAIFDREILRDVSQQTQKYLEFVGKYIPKLISELKDYDINDLVKVKCFLRDPDNTYFDLFDRYQIGLLGIKDIVNNIDITKDSERISLILKEFSLYLKKEL